MLKRLLQSSVFALSIVACGGGGGGDSSGGGGGGDGGLPPERPRVNLTIRSNNHESTVNVYAYDGGSRGIILDSAKTESNGIAVLRIYYDTRPVLIEITGGQFKETGTGSRVRLSGSQSLKALAICNGNDFSITVSPLTHIAAAKTMEIMGEYSSFNDAVSAGHNYISQIYGFDVLNTPIVDISDPINATGSCTDSHRQAFILAGMSLWTSDAAGQNGASGQLHYNSILLSKKLASDIANDGILNGGETFGNVPIDQSVYQAGFGNCITRVIASYLNATQLDEYDFIGIDIVTATNTEENQILGGSFDDRIMMVNRSMVSDQYSVFNTGNTPIFVEILDVGAENNLTHEYYDAVRQHTIRRHRDIVYRGRDVFVGWPQEIEPCEGNEWQCGHYDDWIDITSYQHWETGVWNRVDLPPTENTDINHNSDTLPADRHQNWEYFITKIAGDVRNQSIDNYNDPASTRTYAMLHDPLGTHNQLKAQMLCDYVIGQNGGYTPEQECWAGPGQNALSYAVGYDSNLPHTVRSDGRWIIYPDQFQHLTTYLDIEITPEIQRNYIETFVTINAPHNTITAEHSAHHAFGGVSVSVFDGNGNPVTLTGDYYIVPVNSQIVIRKSIKTPGIQLYSSGDTTYTPTTFDSRLMWVIEKSIRLSIRQQASQDLVGQKPVYDVQESSQATYEVTR